MKLRSLIAICLIICFSQSASGANYNAFNTFSTGEEVEVSVVDFLTEWEAALADLELSHMASVDENADTTLEPIFGVVINRLSPYRYTIRATFVSPATGRRVTRTKTVFAEFIGKIAEGA